MMNGATGNILMDDPFFIIIIISYILLGRILQLGVQRFVKLSAGSRGFRKIETRSFCRTGLFLSCKRSIN